MQSGDVRPKRPLGYDQRAHSGYPSANVRILVGSGDSDGIVPKRKLQEECRKLHDWLSAAFALENVDIQADFSKKELIDYGIRRAFTHLVMPHDESSVCIWTLTGGSPRMQAVTRNDRRALLDCWEHINIPYSILKSEII